MNPPNQSYALAYEIVNAVMMSVVVFVCGSVLIALSFAALLTFKEIVTSEAVLSTIWAALSLQELPTQIGRAIFFLLMTVFGIGAWSVIACCIGLLQCAVFAIPIAKLATKGLADDAARGWGFYIIAGAIVGGGPWWLLAFITFDRTVDLGSALLILVPGTAVGLIAGAILKRRLLKLAMKQ